MDAYLFATVASAFLLSGLVKGAVGIGQATTAVAILTTALGLREAVPLLVVPVVAANLWQVLTGDRAVHLIRRFWTMAAGAGIGIWLGTLTAQRINKEIAIGEKRKLHF